MVLVAINEESTKNGLAVFDKQELLTSLKIAFEHEIESPNKEQKTISYACALLGTMKSVLVISASYSFLNESDKVSTEAALCFFRSKHLVSLSMFNSLSSCSLDALVKPLSGVIFTEKNLCNLHQFLACIDISIEHNRLTLSLSKNQRDAAGSYFTPEELAQETTQHAFSQYLEKYRANTKKTPCRVADLSCGAGEFLVAALRCAKERDMSSVEIWAYDVDPMALLIAFSRVYRASKIFSNILHTDGLEERFKLGNPLVEYAEIDTECCLEDREQLFFRGLLYSEGMYLSENSFPEDGFDILLGNPPWEKIRFEDRKFFDLTVPDIAAMSNKATRSNAIAQLAKNDTYQITELYKERLACFDWFKKYGRSAKMEDIGGEPNTYVLFVQVVLDYAAKHFVAAQIIKSSLLTAPVNARYSSSLIEKGLITEAYLFSNRKKIFSIDGRERFCVLFLGLGKKRSIDVSFGNERPGDFKYFEMMRINSSDLAAINPQTATLPDLSNNKEFFLLLDLQNKHKLFEAEYPKCHFGRLVHLTSHAKYISHCKSDGFLDVFEGKFIGRHDSRYSTFDGIPMSQRYKPKVRARIMGDTEKRCSTPTARYFIAESAWTSISQGYSQKLMLCWRSLTSSTNSRTMIASLCQFQPACQSVQFLQCDSDYELSLLAGLFNSKPFDYIIKKKIPGIDLTQSIVRQMPVPSKEVYENTIEYGGVFTTVAIHILTRLLRVYSYDSIVSAALLKLAPVSKITIGRDQALDELDELYLIAYGFSEEQKQVIRTAFV